MENLLNFLFELEPIFLIIGVIGIIGILNCLRIILKVLFLKEEYSIEEQNLLNKIEKENKC